MRGRAIGNVQNGVFVGHRLRWKPYFGGAAAKIAAEAEHPNRLAPASIIARAVS